MDWFLYDNGLRLERVKLAHITPPAFKKGSKNSKENYRTISILPNISKIYKRCMYKQMSDYLGKFFSKFQCGFRLGISAQHCLLAMIEKWKKCVDKGKTSPNGSFKSF